MIKLIKENGIPKVGVYEIMVDTADEVEDLDDLTYPQAGSIALCIENSKTYMLNGSGEWTEVNFKKGGSGGEVKIVTWADGTDEEIIAMLNAHYEGKIDIHDYWSVGDTRTISLSAMEATGVSESHVAQDIDMVLMNAGGKILSDGETECAFVVGQNHLLLEDGYINSTFTNVGGWKECERREWCNSVYKDAFPSSIIPAFKEFINKTSSGGKPGTYVIEDSIDTFGLFAEVEITGNPLQSLPGEGQHIEWYQTASNRVKTYPDGTERIYFSRSPWRNNALHWVYIKTDGKADSTDTNYKIGLAPFGVI